MENCSKTEPIVYENDISFAGLLKAARAEAKRERDIASGKIKEEKLDIDVFFFNKNDLMKQSELKKRLVKSRKGLSKQKKQVTRNGYRSKFEREFAAYLTSNGIKFMYECRLDGNLMDEHVIRYTRCKCGKLDCCKIQKYFPDFTVVTPSGKFVYLETKGQFKSQDRTKHECLKNQQSDRDIRLVFYRPHDVTTKGNRGETYAEWCNRKDIPWSSRSLPWEWIKEFKS